MNVHSLARTTPHSRALLVRRVREQNWSVDQAALAAGISVRTAYKWLARHREQGAGGLQDASSRPRHIPRRVEPDKVAVVLDLRRSRRSGPEIARQLRMPRSTVARVLQREGLSHLKNLEPKEPPRRYQRRHAGELIHLDVKKLGRIGRVGHRIHGDRSISTPGVGWEFIHVCIDDATRLAYAESLPNELGVTAVGFLRRALAWYRRLGVRVRRVMTDNGSCYVARVFQEACHRLGVRHLRIRPYRPQTNGKAERFIQTMLRECMYARAYENSKTRQRALKAWLRYYNRQRPHGGIAGQTPYSRLKRDS